MVRTGSQIQDRQLAKTKLTVGFKNIPGPDLRYVEIEVFRDVVRKSDRLLKWRTKHSPLFDSIFNVLNPKDDD